MPHNQGMDSLNDRMEQAWNKMVEHAAIAARTTGAERIAARLAARKTFLEFEAMRNAQDRAFNRH
jgi:hypothetical protein